jgi:hypothetical protein
VCAHGDAEQPRTLFDVLGESPGGRSDGSLLIRQVIHVYRHIVVTERESESGRTGITIPGKVPREWRVRFVAACHREVPRQSVRRVGPARLTRRARRGQEPEQPGQTKKPQIDLAASCNAFRNAVLAALYSLLVAAGQAELMTMTNRSSLNVVIDWPKMPTAS